MAIIITIGVIFIYLAACFEAAMDTLMFHYYDSEFNRFENNSFWNPVMSWKNKYMNGDPASGPKFFGSTTIFVFVTDGWHMFKFLRNLFLWIGFSMSAYVSHHSILEFVVVVIGLRCVYGLSFSVNYKLLKSKQ